VQNPTRDARRTTIDRLRQALSAARSKVVARAGTAHPSPSKESV
jgi:hypothetical protein